MTIKYFTQRPTVLKKFNVDVEHHISAVDSDEHVATRKYNNRGGVTDSSRPKVVGKLSVAPATDEYDMTPRQGNTPSESKYSTNNGTLFTHYHTPPTIYRAEVDHDYQRRGIGTNMLHVANDHFGEEISHSDSISGPAFAWAQKAGGLQQTDAPTGLSWTPSHLTPEDQDVTEPKLFDMRRLPPANRGKTRVERNQNTQLRMSL